MKDFEHIQSLWQTHQPELKVSAEEVLSQAKKDVRSFTIRSQTNLIGMCVAVLILIALWKIANFNSLSTHIGLTIMLVAIVVNTFIQYRDHRLIAKQDSILHPLDYINALKRYQKNRYLLFGKIYYIYVICFTIGFLLFFNEIVAMMPLWQKILVYAGTFAWILFCTFYYKNRYAAKEKERVNELLDQFEHIGKQLREE